MASGELGNRALAGTSGGDVVVGLDVGATSVNATVLDVATGQVLVGDLHETPSRVL